MDFSNLSFGFETVRWIVVTAIGIYAWIIGRQSASSKELLELRTRITKLESEMRQVPSQQQIHDLALQVSRVVGSVDALAQGIAPIRKSVDRMESYLLNNK
ncbi:MULTISPECIES: DUF2730 family protein [Pseudomonadota]|uniref:DUF2730 family protein n=1 Tax=Pseudomonadota TaxID=1224 RepID=UPI0006D43B96|nr:MULTISPECIES: DUF2730 family protein [Gammaproteobacteria]MBG7114713.1 DUF2730 family protein [Pseudomonas aeruginosa]HDT5887835.1 DUF2730 family protein [Aeromonas dhakensis]HEB4980713.1 DUF2730 family protein [Aeromonas dhakensis]